MGTPRASLLSAEEARRALAGLREWKLSPDGKSISRELVLSGFSAAAAFIGKIAPLADAADHHPDVHLTGYKRVRIELSTHSAGGLTEKDFALAKQIDEVK